MGRKRETQKETAAKAIELAQLEAMRGGFYATANLLRSAIGVLHIDEMAMDWICKPGKSGKKGK